MTCYDNLYPDLTQNPRGENYRFCKSGEMLNRLDDEVKHYEKVRKKYSKAQNGFSNVSVGTGLFSVGLSASGLGTSLTGFGVVVGLPLGVLGGVFGATSVGCGVASKRLMSKVLKHEQTVALGREKANVIRDLISKAFNDNKVSEEEFGKILKIVSDYEDEKIEIRRKARAKPEKKVGKRSNERSFLARVSKTHQSSTSVTRSLRFSFQRFSGGFSLGVVFNKERGSQPSQLTPTAPPPPLFV